MCMLCVVPPNVIPSRDKLENSALNNPHGFGFAIVVSRENRIIVEHSMDPDESINRFLELRGKYPEDYAMWHARYATHGSTTLSNCHPFEVGEGGLTYLAHNGILGVLEYKHDDRSDTRIFAEDVLAKIGGVTMLDDDQIWNLLEDFTTGSKVCILTIDPDAENQCYLLHQEKGTRDASGVWWSNNSCNLDYYKDYKSTSSSLYAGDKFDPWPAKYSSEKDYDLFAKDNDATWRECPECNGFSTEDEIMLYDQTCYACGYCFDCKKPAADDMCYSQYKGAYYKYRDAYRNGTEYPIASREDTGF